MKHAPAGFTLLEVLVALVIFGLVLAGLVQGARFGLRVADRQTATIAGMADLDATDRVLRALIAQMDPGTLTSAPLLTAGPTSLAFTAPLDAVAPHLAVGEADVSLGVTADHRLVLRWAPHLHVTPLTAPATPTETTLMPGVGRVTFAYCCGSGADEPWLSSWTDRDLPALIRIQLTFAPGTHQTWPMIVVAPIRMRVNG